MFWNWELPSCEGNFFLVPVSPPVRFEGGENCVFLNVRFVTNFCRLALSAALPCDFTFFWRPPAHFGDLELTGTKKCFPEIWNALMFELRLEHKPSDEHLEVDLLKAHPDESVWRIERLEIICVKLWEMKCFVVWSAASERAAKWAFSTSTSRGRPDIGSNEYIQTSSIPHMERLYGTLHTPRTMTCVTLWRDLYIIELRNVFVIRQISRVLENCENTAC